MAAGGPASLFWAVPASSLPKNGWTQEEKAWMGRPPTPTGGDRELNMTLQPGGRPVPNYPDYVLIRKLGAGAFGEVWQAHGPGGFDVALKFIHLHAHVRALELRSLEVMKSIRDPHLVSLFGAWYKDDWLILAMELCDRSLQDRLAEAMGQKLPGIPLNELLSFMSDAAHGLDALNAKQVQHRDVKPANLLLLNSGVKVSDFGLAKALEQTVASNSGAGTLAYTAPECFKGELTQQSDQYSLAVTYYHLRTGHLLFNGDQAKMMYAHLELEPDLSHMAPAERVALARALSKEPCKRWPNCKAFINELAAGQAKEPRRPRGNRKERVLYVDKTGVVHFQIPLGSRTTREPGVYQPNRESAKSDQAEPSGRVAKPNLEIRWSPALALWPMIIGGMLAGAVPLTFTYACCKSGTWVRSSGGEILGLLAFIGLFVFAGCWMFQSGWKRKSDRRAKLSITTEGLRDHRTDAFVRWTDFRGVRLFSQTTNGNLTSATMYVKVAQAEVDREIAFDVYGLDRKYEEIAGLVQQRGMAALEKLGVNW